MDAELKRQSCMECWFFHAMHCCPIYSEILPYSPILTVNNAPLPLPILFTFLHKQVESKHLVKKSITRMYRFARPSYSHFPSFMALRHSEYPRCNQTSHFYRWQTCVSVHFWRSKTKDILCDHNVWIRSSLLKEENLPIPGRLIKDWPTSHTYWHIPCIYRPNGLYTENGLILLTKRSLHYILIEGQGMGLLSNQNTTYLTYKR